MDNLSETEAPHPYDFADQLIRQLLGDLDGVLFDGEAAADDAFALLAREAGAGGSRGATLVLLCQAALAAHGTLLDETEDAALERDIGGALRQLAPGIEIQLPALLAHAERLVRTLAIAEQGSEPVTTVLAQAIVRFYEALREDDAAVAGRALIELRSMTVHIDATAAALEAARFDPRRIVRPNRFHDWFMRYASLAQSPEARDSEQAVATLGRDGRISAVVTEDVHPLEAAARLVREQITGDDTARDHTLARIRALLDFIDTLRRRPQVQIGDTQNDQTVYVSLVLAAATAPLDAGGGFRLSALGQIARYNQILLRGVRMAPATTH